MGQLSTHKAFRLFLDSVSNRSINLLKHSSSLPVWPVLAIFERSWLQIFFKKVAKIFGDFWGYFSKLGLFNLKRQWILVGQLLITLNFNIWSHWSFVTYLGRCVSTVNLIAHLWGIMSKLEKLFKGMKERASERASERERERDNLVIYFYFRPTISLVFLSSLV